MQFYGSDEESSLGLSFNSLFIGIGFAIASLPACTFLPHLGFNSLFIGIGFAIDALLPRLL